MPKPFCELWRGNHCKKKEKKRKILSSFWIFSSVSSSVFLGLHQSFGVICLVSSLWSQSRRLKGFSVLHQQQRKHYSMSRHYWPGDMGLREDELCSRDDPDYSNLCIASSAIWVLKTNPWFEPRSDTWAFQNPRCISETLYHFWAVDGVSHKYSWFPKTKVESRVGQQ